MTDEANWTKAAPMLPGGLPKLEAVRDEYNIASRDNALQLQFLSYNMGVAVQDTTKYIMPEESARTDYDFDAVWTGAEVVLGVDLSLVGDLTALVFLTEKDGVMYAHVEALGSKNTLDKLPEAQATLLRNMENLTITQGAYITAPDVLDVLQQFVHRTNCQLTYIGYDPSRYDNLRQLIDDYFLTLQKSANSQSAKVSPFPITLNSQRTNSKRGHWSTIRAFWNGA